jgi:hypothetical protein
LIAFDFSAADLNRCINSSQMLMLKSWIASRSADILDVDILPGDHSQRKRSAKNLTATFAIRSVNGEHTVHSKQLE